MGLADIMAKHGVGMSAKPDDGDADMPEGDDSEMEHCLTGVADAVASGDKEAIKSALRDLVDCIKHDDMEQDESE